MDFPLFTRSCFEVGGSPSSRLIKLAMKIIDIIEHPLTAIKRRPNFFTELVWIMFLQYQTSVYQMMCTYISWNIKNASIIYSAGRVLQNTRDPFLPSTLRTAWLQDFVPGPRTVKLSHHLLLVLIQLDTCMLSVPCHHAMYVLHYFISFIM